MVLDHIPAGVKPLFARQYEMLGELSRTRMRGFIGLVYDVELLPGEQHFHPDADTLAAFKGPFQGELLFTRTTSLAPRSGAWVRARRDLWCTFTGPA